MPARPGAVPDSPLLLVQRFAAELRKLAPVEGIYLHGSMATGDYREGRSDIDVVTVTSHALSDEEHASIAFLHRELAALDRRGRAVHCVYVNGLLIGDAEARHPAWRHSRWAMLPLSSSTRLELATTAVVLHGPPASTLFGTPHKATLRAGIREETLRYWLPKTWCAWLWFEDAWVDVGLTSAVRALTLLQDGKSITKSQSFAAMRRLEVARWLVDDLERRRNEPEASRPRAASFAFRARRAATVIITMRRLLRLLAQTRAAGVRQTRNHR